MRKLRKDDQIVVLAGRDKGRRGTVLRMMPNDRVLVEGVNMVKKHTRPNPQTNEQGGILDMEAPIAISNIALLNPKTDKADRVGIRIEDGKRVRYFKSTSTLVDD